MPGAWAAPVVKRPALLLPLTALVMGTCTPLAVLTDELPTKADSLSWDSPLAEAEQLAPPATVVVVAAVVVVVAFVVVVVAAVVVVVAAVVVVVAAVVVV